MPLELHTNMAAKREKKSENKYNRKNENTWAKIKWHEGEKIKENKKESEKGSSSHCINIQMGLFFLRFHGPTYPTSKQKDQGHQLASGGD